MESIRETDLQVEQTAQGNGAVLDFGVAQRTCDISVVVVCVGTISTGVIKIEEADDPDYAGTWSLVDTVDLTTLTGGAVKVVHVTRGIYRCLRARISTAVTGASGKVSAKARNN